MKTQYSDMFRKLNHNFFHRNHRPEDEVSVVSSGGGGCGAVKGVVPRLRVEKIDGGLLVAGVQVSSSCQAALPISGLIFLVIGTILTIIAYQGRTAGESLEEYKKRESTSANSRVLGPVCLAMGVFMLLAGLLVCLLMRHARNKEQRVCFHCPIHGDFFPVTPIPVSAVQGRKPSLLCAGGVAEGSAVPPQPPPCPMSRNSVPNVACPACPAAKPFVINSSLRCAEYFWPLTVSQDIASFPVSRTPSPIPVDHVVDVENGVSGPMVLKNLPEVKLVAPASDHDVHAPAD